MSRNGRYLTGYLAAFVLTCFAVNSNASSFSERFKAFVADEPSQDAQKIESPLNRLPEQSPSTQCMSCHDGSGATSISLKHADTPMRFTQHGSNNHPVGMDYRQYAEQNPAVYVPLEQLDKRILLENGAVTCISCHALKTAKSKAHGALFLSSGLQGESSSSCTADKQLTTGGGMTELCFSCHAM